jgi:hypothetical protein
MEGISHRGEAGVHSSHVEEPRSKYVVLGYGPHLLYTGGTQVSRKLPQVFGVLILLHRV